jgi:hypothetical protein
MAPPETPPAGSIRLKPSKYISFTRWPSVSNTGGTTSFLKPVKMFWLTLNF